MTPDSPPTTDANTTTTLQKFSFDNVVTIFTASHLRVTRHDVFLVECFARAPLITWLKQSRQGRAWLACSSTTLLCNQITIHLIK